MSRCLCRPCSLDVRKIRESSGHLLLFLIIFPSVFPESTPPLVFFFFFEGGNKLASGCLHFRKSPISQIARSDIISSDIVLYIYFNSLALSFLSVFFFLYQIFEGNSNYDTPELRLVEPLLTRFIRIYPERATPAGMGLRLEVLGCELAGK